MNSTTSEQTFEAKVPVPELTKGEREYQAFLRLLPELLATYRGRYVAIHKGQVIDSDLDDIALVRRVHTQVGYIPIHVGLVSDAPALVRIPHYREYHPHGGVP
jgi:hypothetical protein